jgi:hypothetical protein
MGRLYDALVMFLQEDDLKFTQMAGETATLMTFNCENASYLCYARVREEQEQVMFYTIYPLRAPAERRAEVAEFVTRVNYGLALGNMEMDVSDGEVRFKTSVDASVALFSLPLLRSLMQTCIATADRYYPGYTALLYSDISPAEAVARIEND